MRPLDSRSSWQHLSLSVYLFISASRIFSFTPTDCEVYYYNF